MAGCRTKLPPAGLYVDGVPKALGVVAAVVDSDGPLGVVAAVVAADSTPGNFSRGSASILMGLPLDPLFVFFSGFSSSLWQAFPIAEKS